MKVRICLILFFVLMFVSITGLAAENRQALLIANGSYKNFSSLGTPVSEAQALSVTLKQLGFQVTLLKNATREEMLEALDVFGSSLKGKGGVAFFHYGGHAVQVGGKNYLIPVDANLPDERKVTTRTIDVDEVMSTLDAAGADTNIIILDACRNNPLPAGVGRSASRGLTVVGEKPRNSVIVYSAEANSVAQDGLFTPALTKIIEKPGMSFSDVLVEVRREVYQKSKGSQIPGEYNQLFTPIYLAGVSGGNQNSISSSGKESTDGDQWGNVQVIPGSLSISVASEGNVEFNGKTKLLPAGGTITINNVIPGEYRVTVRYTDGNNENRIIRIESGIKTQLELTYKPNDAQVSSIGESTEDIVLIEKSWDAYKQLVNKIELLATKRKYREAESEIESNITSLDGYVIKISELLKKYYPESTIVFYGLPISITSTRYGSQESKEWSSKYSTDHWVIAGDKVLAISWRQEATYFYLIMDYKKTHDGFDTTLKNGNEIIKNLRLKY
jgi:hypothetical protein